MFSNAAVGHRGATVDLLLELCISFNYYILIIFILFCVVSDPQFRYYVDTTYLNVPRPGMEVVSYMKEGSIDNWDLFEKVMDYAYAKVVILLFFHFILVNVQILTISLTGDQIVE